MPLPKPGVRQLLQREIPLSLNVYLVAIRLLPIALVLRYAVKHHSTPYQVTYLYPDFLFRVAVLPYESVRETRVLPSLKLTHLARFRKRAVQRQHAKDKQY